MIRRKLIKKQVEQLLGENGIESAPVPVDQIAESLGINVQKKDIDDDMSGFLYRDRERDAAVIGVNANQHKNRRRFTVAHELGHFLLHEGDVHVDHKFNVWFRDEDSSKGTDLEEREANLFAAELLMPASFLQADIEDIGPIDVDSVDELADLAKRYQVSQQAMTIRLAHLGHIRE